MKSSLKFQMMAVMCIIPFYDALWKIPTYYIGHRVDTVYATSHLKTFLVISKALILRYVNELFQIKHILPFACLYFVEQIGNNDFSTTFLMLICCVIVDLYPILLQFFETKDHDEKLNGIASPLPSPLRNTIEKVAREHNVFPHNWNGNSLTCASISSSLTYSCGINAAAVGTNVLVLNNHSIRTMKERHLVALALHELGHLKGDHLKKDNMARVFIQFLRAGLVFFVTLFTILKSNNKLMNDHNPLVIYVIYWISSREYIIHPLFNVLGRRYLNEIAHQQEIDADKVAYDCGYGMSIIEILQNVHQRTSNVYFNKWYSNHPTNDERINIIKQYTKQN
jgi:Zn-dependent protease with chaperone function